LARRIQERIQAGELRPGDTLPPRSKLAAALGVNPRTVGQAYNLLARDGLVVSSQGRCTSVAGPGGRPSAPRQVPPPAAPAPKAPRLLAVIQQLEPGSDGVDVSVRIVEGQTLSLRTSRTMASWLRLAAGGVLELSIEEAGFSLARPDPSSTEATNGHGASPVLPAPYGRGVRRASALGKSQAG